jgi:hypothetical protein
MIGKHLQKKVMFPDFRLKQIILQLSKLISNKGCIKSSFVCTEIAFEIMLATLIQTILFLQSKIYIYQNVTLQIAFLLFVQNKN